MTEIAIVSAFVVTPLSGLMMFWLALRFLWRVYMRGGTADLAEAAKSLQLARGVRPNSRRRRPVAGRSEAQG